MPRLLRPFALGIACGLFVLWIFFFVVSPVQARAPSGQNPPTPTPAMTPDPTIMTLQDQVTALKTQIDMLETQVDLNKQATEIKALKDVVVILAGAALVSIVGVGIGITSPFVISKRVQSKMEERLNAAIYKADPTYLSIYVPSRNFDKEAKRLEQLGFKALSPYPMLTATQSHGIVIYAAETLSDIETLKRFILDNKLDQHPGQVAFIVYSPSGHIEGANAAIKGIEFVVFANSPLTIATRIYELARVLTI